MDWRTRRRLERRSNQAGFSIISAKWAFAWKSNEHGDVPGESEAGGTRFQAA